MTELTFRQIEALIWTSRLRSFTLAADHLGITQPTLSSRIAALERTVGATLFSRRGNRVALTPAGHDACVQSERILDLTRRLEAQLIAAHPWRMTLRLGSSEIFAATTLPSVLDRVRSAHPELDVDLTVSTSARLNRMLAQGDLDAAFLSNAEPCDDVLIVPLTMIDLAFVSHRRERLSELVTPKDLASRRILTNPDPSAIYSAVRSWFSGAGHTPVRQSSCNSLPATCRLVESGVGVGVIPVPMIRRYISTEHVIVHRASPQLPRLQHALAVSDLLAQNVVSFLTRVGRTTAKLIDRA